MIKSDLSGWDEVSSFELKPAFSDIMAKRDNFFHSCWMRMKQMHPESMVAMNDIELYIAGLEPGGFKDQDDAGTKDADEGFVL